MPRVRARRKSQPVTSRSSRKRTAAKIVTKHELNGDYDSDEDIPRAAAASRNRKDGRRRPRSNRSAVKATPAKRRGRKAASVSSDDRSDIADSDDDSSDEDASSEEEVDEDAVEDEEESEISDDVEDGSDTTQKRTIIPRDRDPVYVQDRVFQPLQLPASSEDLIVPNDLVLQALGIYEILRRFSSSLQLTPFRFEDFCCALVAEENSRLTAEIFSSILRLIVRESETSRVWLAPHDEKDSIHLPTLCLDHMTWPELIRAYLGSSPEFAVGLRIVNQPLFPCVPAKDKLELLELLCSACLRLPGIIRNTLTAEYTIQHEESCRSCQKLGDLICCELCPATYHLECSVPPLKEIPEGEWICSVCRANQVTGVTDCDSMIQKQNFNLRQEPIGLDRHGRRFAFMARRLFIYEEDESAVWYYSSVPQFEQVLSLLDTDDLEKELCEALADLKEEITSHLETTLKLTKKAAVSRIAYIEQANAVILEERKHKEETELKKSDEKMEVDSVAKSDSDIKKESSDQDPEAETSQKDDTQEGGSGVATRTRTGALVQKSYTEVMKPVMKDVVIINHHNLPTGDLSTVFDLSKHAGSAFKLGLEGGFRSYRNIFTENTLAQNKAQKAEERDRRRHLSVKFYVSADKAAPLTYEFRWPGALYGVTRVAMATVKAALLDMEKSIHAAFFHPAWADNRATWLASVEAADKPDKLAPLLITLEASFRPSVFSAAWHETLGCVRWGQFAAPDREESRNQERRRRREEDELVTRSAKKCYVSFVLGVHHQIWKHKGEEFRLSGKGGVFWWSSRYQDEVDDTPARCVTPPIPDPKSSDPTFPEVFDISACLNQTDNLMYPVDGDVRAKLDKLWQGVGVSIEKVIENTAQPSIDVPKDSAAASETGDKEKLVEKAAADDAVKENVIVPEKPALPKVDKVVPSLLGLMTFKKDAEMLDVYHLSKNDFHGLAVNAGLHEMPGFKYDYKTSPSWEYSHFPRPNVRTAWRFRTYSVRNWGGVALQLRLLHAGMRWDDLQSKPPGDGKKTLRDETATVHSQAIEKRPVLMPTLSFPRFEYKIKRVIVPLKEGNGRNNQKSTPGREGLRERRIDPIGAKDPYALESWVPEEDLELWEIKSFYDRIEHPLPVEIPKPAPVLPPQSPATLTTPSGIFRSVQRQGRTEHYYVKMHNGGRSQLVILPSGYEQMGGKGTTVFTPVRIHDTRTTTDTVRPAATEETPAEPAESLQPFSLSAADKNEKWIKEQSERVNKRVSHLMKALPTKTLNLKSVYARRQEDLCYVVFQAMVNHNPDLIGSLPDAPGPSLSPTFTLPDVPPLLKKRRPPKKERRPAPRKASPKNPPLPSAPLTNGLSPVPPSPTDSAPADGIPTIRIKKNLYQEPVKKSPDEVVGAGKSRAKMISTAPKVPEIDPANRTPKRRGRKSNALLQQEAEEAAAAERQAALERARITELARAEAAAAAALLPKIPSPLPERKMDPGAALITPVQKAKKRKHSKTSDGSKVATSDGGLPKALIQGDSFVTPQQRGTGSGGTLGSSGKTKKRKHQEVEAEPISAQQSPKKRRNNAKIHGKSREENGTDLHCYCRTPYDQDRFYIGCDKCEKWFHGECVNVKENDASLTQNAKWFCPDCETPSPPPSVTAPVLPPQPAPIVITKVKSNKKKRRISEVAASPAEEASANPLKLKIRLSSAVVEPQSAPKLPKDTAPLPKLLLKFNKKSMQDMADDTDDLVEETVEEPKSSTSSVPSKIRRNSTNSGTGKKSSKVKKQKQTTKEGHGEVYCLCAEPASASSGYRKFIKCDKCSQWFHPRCVGLTTKKADALSTYACPGCQKTPSFRDFLFRPLSGDDFKILQAVVTDIKKNRVAGPFLEPVDPLQAPDYYLVITDPMDFATINSKLHDGSYKTMFDFTRDCGLVFDNARTYNQEGTVYYKGAEQLEEIFVARMNKLRLNWKG